MKHINIIRLNKDEARAFFLKEESYSNIVLPSYFTFQPLLDTVSKNLSGKNLKEFIIQEILTM